MKEMGNVGDGVDTLCPRRNDIWILYLPHLRPCYNRYHHSLADCK